MSLGATHFTSDAANASEERSTGVRTPRLEERDALLSWLDDGLRDGRRGALVNEFPLAIREDALHRHSVVLHNGRCVSHAFGLRIEALSGDRQLPCGLVSLVYTDPGFRGQGLASLCVAHCVEQLRSRGAAVALLWSDRPAIYQRLGFEPAGREWLYRIDGDICRRAASLLDVRLETSMLRDTDLPHLSRLYDAKPCRAARAPGQLEALARTPGCQVRVARGPDGPEAYAAVGRGDDFRGVVHEWAGRPDAVISCLAGLCKDGESMGLVAGPVDEEPLPILRAAGSLAERRSFALARVVDPQRAWAAWSGKGEVASAPDARDSAAVLRLGSASMPLSQTALLALLFGPEPDRTRLCRAAAPGSALSQALPDELPAPFFLWGFDSL